MWENVEILTIRVPLMYLRFNFPLVSAVLRVIAPVMDLQKKRPCFADTNRKMVNGGPHSGGRCCIFVKQTAIDDK